MHHLSYTFIYTCSHSYYPFPQIFLQDARGFLWLLAWGTNLLGILLMSTFDCNVVHQQQVFLTTLLLLSPTNSISPVKKPNLIHFEQVFWKLMFMLGIITDHINFLFSKSFFFKVNYPFFFFLCDLLFFTMLKISSMFQLQVRRRINDYCSTSLSWCVRPYLY